MGPKRDADSGQLPTRGPLFPIDEKQHIHPARPIAPFAHIDQIRPGDPITLKTPYATFRYRARRHVIVPAADLGVLRSPRHELLALQAYHPRFFAATSSTHVSWQSAY
jgi:hypothetical protein